jgi:hypothetical protein
VVPKPKPKPKPKPAATRAVVATNGKKKLVNVDDATIASMAVNTSFTSEFPILVAAKNYAGKSCSGCGGAARKRAEVFRKIKEGLAAMPPEKKRRLKELLGTEQVRITYKNAGGKPVVLTIS